MMAYNYEHVPLEIMISKAHEFSGHLLWLWTLTIHLERITSKARFLIRLWFTRHVCFTICVESSNLQSLFHFQSWLFHCHCPTWDFWLCCCHSCWCGCHGRGGCLQFQSLFFMITSQPDVQLFKIWKYGHYHNLFCLIFSQMAAVLVQ